ncbi:uncharacterized protein [Parasteatoda tepidariorum]|uniref:uncharacterized protein n=1 Tax=Parasteatoda tepidariorum TaxID=114398 RepID=UPI0039BD927D
MGKNWSRKQCDNFSRDLSHHPKRAECDYVAIYSKEDGKCLGSHPTEGQEVSTEEVEMLKRAFINPTMLYSYGIVLRGDKFTFVKVEKEAILGRKVDESCLIVQLDQGILICIYGSSLLTKDIYKHFIEIYEKYNRA